MPIVANDVLQQLLAFRRERDWEKFHTPKNLAIAISVEVAELLQIFQWTSDENAGELLARERTALVDEVADVAILLSYLCHDLGTDLDVAIQSKMEKNRQKYPVHLAFGTATKYDRLT